MSGHRSAVNAHNGSGLPRDARAAIGALHPEASARKPYEPKTDPALNPGKALIPPMTVKEVDEALEFARQHQLLGLPSYSEYCADEARWYRGWELLNDSGYGKRTWPIEFEPEVLAALAEWRALWNDAPAAILPQLLQSKEDAIEAAALAKGGCNPNARNLIDGNIKKFIGTLDGNPISMGFGCYIKRFGTDVKLCERHAGSIVVGTSLLEDEPVRLVYRPHELDVFLAKVPEAASLNPFGLGQSARTGTPVIAFNSAK